MTTIYVQNKDSLPDRAENDLYVTERTLIRAALARYKYHVISSILDVGAGDGRWGQIAHESSLHPEGGKLVGVELRETPKPVRFTEWYAPQDFMTWETQDRFDLVVSNPPYYMAEDIVRKSFYLLNGGGRLVVLLRLAFQAGVERYMGLWQDIPPVEVAVCSRRPSFYNNKTNGTDYGVFFFEANWHGQSLGKPRSWKTTLLLHERDKV